MKELWILLLAALATMLTELVYDLHAKRHRTQRAC